MSQHVEKRSLAQDHPEFREVIHEMKMNDAHFARNMGEYEELDKQIVRIEQGHEQCPDLELDAMKLKRVQLKDDLVRQLRR